MRGWMRIWGMALGLAGLLASSAVAADYVTDAEARVKAADWGKLQTLTMTMQEYRYQPKTLGFKAGVPYKLVIRNEGRAKHYFTAPEFFKAIATRKVQGSDGEVKAPYFTALEVYPGKALEIFFIPVTPGSYKLLCTIAGHEEQGMHGTLDIE